MNRLHLSDFDRYIIRQPVFSFNSLFNEEFKTKNLDDIIIFFLNNEIFKSSIYWSSPEIYDRMIKYSNNELNKIDKFRLENTLKKYILRCTTRTIPFGTFAGVSILTINDYVVSNTISDIELRKAQIDRALLSIIINKIENIPTIIECLKYHINPTISLHYSKYRYIGLSEGEYHINTVEQNELIDLLYFNISKKSLTISEIIELLPIEYTFEEKKKFIIELIEIQFFNSEISETLYQQEELEFIEGFLEKQSTSEDSLFLINLVKTLKYLIETINNTPINSIPFEQLENAKAMFKKIDINQKSLFHIDFKKTNLQSDNQLNEGLMKDIKQAIKTLYYLDKGVQVSQTLEDFKRKFNEVYELSEKPLMEVLDLEIGLGFPIGGSMGNHYYDSFIDEIIEPHIIHNDYTNWAPEWLIMLIEKLPNSKNIDLGLLSIPINDEVKPLPPTFYVLGNIIGDNRFFIQNIGGTSGKTLLGRFTHLDNEIQKLYNDISNFERESDPDVIIADIIYIAQGKIGNVTRPFNTSEFEINIVGESLSKNTKIRLNDLYVSVVNNEVILRSASLNKRVIPRLNNAHNFYQSDIAVYKFLASLENQKSNQIDLNLDYKKSRKIYIPRISYGNIILKRATWIIYDTEIQTILQSLDPIFLCIKLLKENLIPQFVVIVEGDHELFLDTRNTSYIELLIGEMKKSKTIILCEWIFPIPIEKDQYINQVVIPFKNLDFKKISKHNVYDKQTIAQKIFYPGSEWVYFKIYCNATYSDTILLELIYPLLSDWLEIGIIKKGYFLRYNDPDYHIRFRILLNDITNFSIVSGQFYEKSSQMIDQLGIRKIELSTYTREIERYGSSYIENVESFFTYDSQLILSLLFNADFSEDTELRVLLAVKNIDVLLNVFNNNLFQKLEFCKKMEKSFEKEFNKKEKRYIYEKYRTISTFLYELMQDNEYNEMFDIRNSKLSHLKLKEQNIPDIIHMSMNRWFPAKQRLYEYLVYIFVRKYYSYQISSISQ
ncbi:lantibiotic dehydratase [Chishuiella sp.]|uniref:lantibiotic dehydratase n=1 Tax=Chishuiella sp. TaxID=1969467 RepID=UPI0028A94815|nr:lantibiotic dehydratase [Chishuiella sp.]